MLCVDNANVWLCFVLPQTHTDRIHYSTFTITHYFHTSLLLLACCLFSRPPLSCLSFFVFLASCV